MINLFVYFGVNLLFS